MQVSVLGFGGAEIGYQGASPRTVQRLLGAALDNGLNLIDTSACYAASEELIGKAVSHRRRDYYLMTKCGHAAGIDLPDWHPSLVGRSIDRSLTRLRTDHLDVVQLHSCELETLRKGDVIAALERARDAGKTRYIGYSGDGEAALYAVRSGTFDTLQISLNLADQEAIELVVPAAAERGLGVIAKRPIANAVWLNHKRPSDWYVLEYWDRLQALGYEFLSGGSSASVAVALRFTLSVPGVHTAIVGTTKPERWEQNRRLAAAGPLPASHYEMIRARWRAVAKPNWDGQR